MQHVLLITGNWSVVSQSLLPLTVFIRGSGYFVVFCYYVCKVHKKLNKFEKRSQRREAGSSMKFFYQHRLFDYLYDLEKTKEFSNSNVLNLVGAHFRTDLNLVGAHFRTDLKWLAQKFECLKVILS